ncbi:antitoxin VbhA family protein [Rhodococcus erythropolis]|uniref:antitoxin VbhA family protein n=1 Tax=Rhodococcus erythropolis TaxID=1833 RepID=UPI00351D8D6F
MRTPISMPFASVVQTMRAVSDIGQFYPKCTPVVRSNRVGDWIHNLWGRFHMSVPSRDEERRRRAVRNVHASMRLEGQIPDLAELDLAELFVTGVIDLEEFHRRLVDLASHVGRPRE